MGGSLSDISKMTGLGITTVSEILREKPGYRQQTRERVLVAARQLNYRPNLIARGLKAGRSMTIGVIVGAFHSPIHAEKLGQVVRQAKAQGYIPYVLEAVAGDDDAFLETVNHLLDRKVDGLIIMHANFMDPQITRRLRSAAVPTVFVGRGPKDWPWLVRYDLMPALTDALAHAASLGHRQAIMVRTPSDATLGSQKFDSWVEASRQAGIELRVDDAFTYKPSSDYLASAFEMMRQGAKQGGLPSLLLMNNDACAMAAVASLQDMGIGVPEDISVIGFDDTAEATYCRPGLTTIRQPRLEVGQAVVDVLFNAMNHELESQDIILPYRFVPRQSTGRAPVPRHARA